MQRANLIVTCLLAFAAVLAWMHSLQLLPFGQLYIYEIDVPLAVTLSAAACFGWLLVWLSERRRDNETRCRKCGYILRGISEPRCSECGERI